MLNQRKQADVFYIYDNMET